LRAEILRFLEDTSGRRNWAHKGLRAAIGGLHLDEALWKPEGGHSVWEQINHTAYWKRYILRRTQGKRTRARQAWPSPGRTAGELGRSIADLGALSRELRAAVAALDPDAFEPKGGRYPTAQLLLGEAAHESYHIGQIFLTRKLYRRYRRHRRRAR
jgi:uncharacterized damage-inducible protein DinB